jgi:serine/threonine protein kinase
MIRLPRIGQILSDRYLILEKLGSGGFSEIYLARDKAIEGYPCRVIKCLRPNIEDALRTKVTRRFFEREAKILGALGQHHDRIPTFHAYYPEAGQVYLVQDYIAGDRLDRWIDNRPRITTKILVSILLELLETLDFVHSHHIIHHDIKPSNIIRRHSDGKLVLIDFGAACWRPQSEQKCYAPKGEETACVVGTEGYMSQEQNRGEIQFNSDLYALGILGIHLLTQAPVQSLKPDESTGELAWHSHLKHRQTSRDLVEILDRMVRSHHRDRYPSAQATIADLEAFSTQEQSIRSKLYGTVSGHCPNPTVLSLYASLLAGGHFSDCDSHPPMPIPHVSCLPLSLKRMKSLPILVNPFRQMELFPPECP